MTRGEEAIVYSERYYDDDYEYRHVSLPRRLLSEQHYREPYLLSERQWRSVGIQQSRGWVHYGIHTAEPWILLFKRPKHFQELCPKLQQHHIRNADNSVYTMNQRISETRARQYQRFQSELESPF